MEMIFTISITIIGVTSALFGAYFLVAYVQGEKNPKKWKSVFPDISLKDSTREEALQSTKLPLKKTNYYILLAILAISFLSAILHKVVSTYTITSFIIYGFASVLINLVIAYVYWFRYYKSKLESNTISFIYLLTLIVPFWIFYILISSFISGATFPIPFQY